MMSVTRTSPRTSPTLITASDIRAAAARISGVAVRTPLLPVEHEFSYPFSAEASKDAGSYGSAPEAKRRFPGLFRTRTSPRTSPTNMRFDVPFEAGR